MRDKISCLIMSVFFFCALYEFFFSFYFTPSSLGGMRSPSLFELDGWCAVFSLPVFLFFICNEKTARRMRDGCWLDQCRMDVAEGRREMSEGAGSSEASKQMKQAYTSSARGFFCFFLSSGFLFFPFFLSHRSNTGRRFKVHGWICLPLSTHLYLCARTTNNTMNSL
ncbi:hypothetical protein B0T26DRAFT_396357 [Lasiosphaeria miniovina]|uniref:Uncharacterized protein n=1 Tax=Lasiosphaeria miniovina TaxID=1954250 RepID=A0AA40DRC8_9PEZI|nr:uncharacterized protein B0T26DRAFT_396357 [Lasiosphaeria miniovina]KAK0709158.1 hypothetical protein B0T26DRAFT_396357 [Lasiosphaeria miniovina]